MNKLKIIIRVLRGELTKLIINLRFKLGIHGLSPITSSRSDIIISLTSYGRRVNKVLPYTLYSLIKQKVKADKIIVWLDEENWSDDRLNSKLQKLKGLGVSFRYCEDIKSYKKLIPTLEEYPSAKIITADDDLYYPVDFVEKLVAANKRNPENVHAFMVHNITFDDNGSIQPYNSWNHFAKQDNNLVNFSTSGGGCIYTSKLLHKDITRTDLFMRLSPSADDVWFFFMSFLNGSKVSIVKLSTPILPLDAFYQKFHSHSNLKSINCDENRNDLQIKAVQNHYSISNLELKNFTTPNLS